MSVNVWYGLLNIVTYCHITENRIQFVEDGDLRSKVKMLWVVSYNETGQNNSCALASQWKKVSTFKEIISHGRPVQISVFV